MGTELAMLQKEVAELRANETRWKQLLGDELMCTLQLAAVLGVRPSGDEPLQPKLLDAIRGLKAECEELRRQVGESRRTDTDAAERHPHPVGDSIDEPQK